MTLLTLVMGMPNAGKTTYCERFGNVVSLDDHRTVAETCKAIRGMDDVTVDGIFPTRETRRRLLRAYEGSSRRCIWLDIPYSECIGRESRGRSSAFFERFRDLFEPPTLDEGWDEIIVVRGDA